MTGKVKQRIWKARGVRGERVRHVAWGYTAQVTQEIDGKFVRKQVRKFCEDWSEQDAIDALREVKDAEPGAKAPTAATLGALATAYLRYKADKGKRSLKEDRRIIGKRLLPYFGPDLEVRRVTAEKVAQYEQQRVGEVSTFTVCNELAVLKHLLRLGKKWGYIKAVPEIELPKKPGHRERYLEAEEITRLLACCDGSKSIYLAPIVTIALNTGMRKEEICSLTWERVNLSTFTISLYKTKSGKPRGIPINADLEAALRALEPDPAKRQGLLFKKGDGRRWGQIRTGFEVALDRAGIKEFRFHDLRHTFASHFVMRGGSLQDLKEILGHSDLKLTLRYAHLSTKHLRSSMERMEGLTRPVSAHGSAHSAKIGPVASAKSLDSLAAPVAQVDRAAVS